MINDIKIGITGLPGSGKTYTLKRVIEMLQKDNITIGGMMDEKVTDGRHETGLTVCNLMTGEKVVFASPENESKAFASVQAALGLKKPDTTTPGAAVRRPGRPAT